MKTITKTILGTVIGFITLILSWIIAYLIVHGIIALLQYIPIIKNLVNIALIDSFLPELLISVTSIFTTMFVVLAITKTDEKAGAISCLIVFITFLLVQIASLIINAILLFFNLGYEGGIMTNIVTIGVIIWVFRSLKK